MKDLLPKMIVPKKEIIQEAPTILPKEKLEQNIVFEGKKEKKVKIKDEPIEEDNEVVMVERPKGRTADGAYAPSEPVQEIEEEIKELEKEIEEAEVIPEEPEPHPVFEEQIEEKPVEKPVKIDKRKGKPSQARLDHLARIREKAAETRRKKAEYKKKMKEVEKQNLETMPVYNHNITPEDVQLAVANALELAERKRLERKEIKKKKKDEEAVLLKKQQEEDIIKKKVMNAVQIPRKSEWEFCFK